MASAEEIVLARLDPFAPGSDGGSLDAAPLRQLVAPEKRASARRHPLVAGGPPAWVDREGVQQHRHLKHGLPDRHRGGRVVGAMVVTSSGRLMGVAAASDLNSVCSRESPWPIAKATPFLLVGPGCHGRRGRRRRHDRPGPNVRRHSTSADVRIASSATLMYDLPYSRSSSGQ